MQEKAYYNRIQYTRALLILILPTTSEYDPDHKITVGHWSISEQNSEWHKLQNAVRNVDNHYLMFYY